MSTTESDLERMLFDETAEPTALPLALLSEITDGFSDKLVIGRGGFAVVYKAMLEKGDVAVKRLPYMYEKDFEREVKCLMKVRHKNIVRLLGYCSDTQGNVGSYNGELFMADKMERLLCFEYLPKGSLRDCIKDGSDGLGWPKSYKLIRGICEGLHYLHHKNIMHLDLKPENILLDNNMVPKITDFGISRCFQEGQTRANLTVVGGTLGYLPPESFTSTEITNKHDLYSLGVIIMEILTGKKEDQAVDDVLNSWSNRLKTSQGNQDYEQIRVCAEIGIECMDFNPEKRPVSMKHIMDRLSEMDDTEVFLAEPSQLLNVHPLTLCFPFEPNKLISCPLQLTNNTYEHVAFRLIEKSGNCIIRQPLYGIVPARSAYTLVVTTEKKTEQPEMINSDLILESSNLGDERIQTFESQLGCDSFFKQVKETKNVLQEVILEAVYTPRREMINSTKIIYIMDAPRKREIFSLDTN